MRKEPTRLGPELFRPAPFDEAAAELTGYARYSYWRSTFRTFLKSPVSIFLLALIVVLVAASFAYPVLSPTDPNKVELDTSLWNAKPGAGHLFGTDSLGRDLYTRTLMGGRMSLLVGIVSTLVSLIIGIAWGATAGFLGGRVDRVMMRIVDILYALPFMFLVILLMVLFGRNIVLIFVAIGAINWLDMARIVRGQTLGLKQREFIEAARVSGVRPARIILRHIVPNLLGVVVIYVTLTIPQVILVESFLSFLGLGVQEPMTSWGVMVSDGALDMENAPWMLVFPAVFLAITLFCFNYLGDGLRDALDPRDRSGR